MILNRSKTDGTDFAIVDMESIESTDKIRYELLQAQMVLANLNLLLAAKWCAEAINGMAANGSTTITEMPNIPTDQEDLDDYSKFILAKSYFNIKEFDRCAHALIGCKSGNGIFLKLYASLLSIDKKTTEETDGSINLFPLPEDTGSNPHGTGNSGVGGGAGGAGLHHPGKDPQNDSNSVISKAGNKDLNSRLSKIIQEIESYNLKPTKSNNNSFLYYLLGVIYNKKKNYKLAQQNTLQSLKIFPYNWSCWQELINSLVSFDEAVELINSIKNSKTNLANHYMFKFFEIVILQEFYQPLINITNNLENLLKIFPNFNFLKIQKFLVCYHSLDYYQAELIFDQILEDDPLRLDDLDTYSNMLYVMEKRSKLSFLAQYASNIDKFKPETCCIIANYHSMKGEHEKAIMYYKRALILNKNSLSAWTLMGHEFVELKNSHAAIESYRRAVDINPKDFRAWYGLGQAYEVLDMHLYSLYYYQRATNLQPLDKRMWQAIGNCYEKISKYNEAIRCFEKALTIDNANKMDSEVVNANGSEIHNNTFDPFICYKLANIYEKIHKIKDCCKYMKLCFDQELEWGITDETSKARLWLARYSLELKKYDEAYELTKDLNHNNAHDIEEARAIAREARNRMNK